MPKKSVGSSKFSLKQEYQKTFEYIKDSKNFIYSAVLIFFIFTAVGFFFDDLANLFFKNFFGVNLDQMILNFIERLLERTQDMTPSQLIGFIFVNNFQSSLFAMVLGSLFGILPLLSAITNGYLLGFVAWFSVEAGGFSTLWKIFPHGIFELPAVFISLGLGFRLGVFLFKNEKQSFGVYVLNSLRVFLLVIIPLLIIAALIEGSLIAFGG